MRKETARLLTLVEKSINELKREGKEIIAIHLDAQDTNKKGVRYRIRSEKRPQPVEETTGHLILPTHTRTQARMANQIVMESWTYFQSLHEYRCEVNYFPAKRLGS